MNIPEAAVRVAREYARTGAVEAVVLAGSVGRGRADRFSDLEIDVYWARPPDETQRRLVVDSLGGDAVDLWPYDANEGEWSDDYRLENWDVYVSGFTAHWMTRCIEAVAQEGDASVVKQLRLSAFCDGRCLYGEALVSRWRRRCRYPEVLATNVATAYLDPARLGTWHHRHTLLDRADVPMLRTLCDAVPPMVLGALCAINRIYVEHPRFKWSASLIERFAVAPPRLRDRLWQACDGPTRQAVPLLEDLLQDTIDLVAERLPQVDLAPLHRELARRH